MKLIYILSALSILNCYASEPLYYEQQFIQGLETANAAQVKFALQSGISPAMTIQTSTYYPNLNQRIKKKYTPLTYLLSTQETEDKTFDTAKELIQHTTPVGRDVSGNHPLQMALAQKKFTVATLLLAQGPLDLSTEIGIALFRTSMETYNSAIVDSILKAHQGSWANLTPLLVIAIYAGNPYVIDNLLDKNIDLNSCYYNICPLEAAIETNNTALCEKLIGRGAIINLVEDGTGLLIKTIRNKNVALTRKLLQSGANARGLSYYAQACADQELITLLEQYENETN